MKKRMTAGRLDALVVTALLVGGLALGCSAYTLTDPFPNGQGGAGAQGQGGDSHQGGFATTTDDPNVDHDSDGFTPAQGDCNDNNAAVHPGVAEICTNGIDDNCNGAVDVAETDMDGDGYGPCQGDCDDSDKNIGPGSPEIPDDGIDNNCDGVIDSDYDSDGFTVAQGDCDDTNADVYPGAAENCFDGVDNNCDGYTDNLTPDRAGSGRRRLWDLLGRLRRHQRERQPGHARELGGNDLDDNCDNLVDEDIDDDGWTVTNGDCDDNDPAINPAALELCVGGVDDNCNGIIDTDCLSPCEMAAITRSSVGCSFTPWTRTPSTRSCLGNTPLPFRTSTRARPPTCSSRSRTAAYGGSCRAARSRWARSACSPWCCPTATSTTARIYAGGAYRITSDLPVIAYQFNPIDAANSFLSDAVVAPARPSLDRYYIVPAWPYGPSDGSAGSGWPAPSCIAATAATQRRAYLAVPTVASTACLLDARRAGRVRLDRRGLSPVHGARPWTASTAPTWNRTSTGRRLLLGRLLQRADRRTLLLLRAPRGAGFGLQTWGMNYVAGRCRWRIASVAEPSLWQVMAQENNTNVDLRFQAAVTGLPASVTLNARQTVEYLVVRAGRQSRGLLRARRQAHPGRPSTWSPRRWATARAAIPA